MRAWPPNLRLHSLSPKIAFVSMDDEGGAVKRMAVWMTGGGRSSVVFLRACILLLDVARRTSHRQRPAVLPGCNSISQRACVESTAAVQWLWRFDPWRRSPGS